MFVYMNIPLRCLAWARTIWFSFSFVILRLLGQCQLHTGMESIASDWEAEEPEIGDSAMKIQARKRGPNRVAHHDPIVVREKLVKRIMLSLTKPSYVLGLGPNNLRSEHRGRLRHLLRRLVKQQNWVEASGALSVYLQATVKDKSPLENQFKYPVLLELVKHVEDNRITPTRIKNLFDVWMRKNGSMKDWPVEKRYAVHLEFILFCIMQGNVEEAHQAVLCLKQENGSGDDPLSTLVMGLIYYELWYSYTPKELQWRDSDQSDSRGTLNMVEDTFSNQVGHSAWHNTVETQIGETPYKCHSDTSVFKDKKISPDADTNQGMGISMEVDVDHQREKSIPNIQPQRFYLDSEEHTGNGDYWLNLQNHMGDTSSLYALEGLDSWLLPFHLPDHNSFEKFIYMHKELLNDYYNEAVKHLQLALDSASSASAALLPLIQLLLMGGQVDEALNRLEKQCCNSASALPFRLKAALLECFDPNNSVLLAKCFEDRLKKDPTCCDSLAKLIKMHQNGEYSVESLLEMIALHLDATYAEFNTWRVFSLCFFILSNNEEDRISACASNNEDGHRQHRSSFLSTTPKMFTEGKLGKAWKLRCRWWLTRHFSRSRLESEIKAGDIQLLTYKAACASYMYGQEFHYVVKAYSFLEKQNDKNLVGFLDKHKHNSHGFYEQFQQKAK